MGLFPCSECGREISDKAAVCQGCGAPVMPPVEPAATLTVPADPICDEINLSGPLAVGDRVQLPERRPARYRSGGIDMRWEPEDDPLLGEVGRIIEIDTDGTFKLDIDSRDGWFAPTWRVSEPDGDDGSYFRIENVDHVEAHDPVVPESVRAPVESGDLQRSSSSSGVSPGVWLAIGVVITLLVILLGILVTRGGLGVGRYTLSQFNEVSTGMTSGQVESVMGAPGELLSDAAVAGYTSQMYTWRNIDGSNMVVQFADGAVITKSQLGLR